MAIKFNDPAPAAASTKSSGVGAKSSSSSPSPLLSSLFSGISGTPLAGSDFITLSPPRPYCVGLVFGRDGHGKSTLLTDYCPDPVYLINLDNRAVEAAYRATSRGRKVYYLAASPSADILDMDHDSAKAHAQLVLSRLIVNYQAAVDAIKQAGRGTIGIDTAKELGDLIKLAVRGRVDRPAGTKDDKGDFGKSDAIINRQLWYFSNRAREGGANLVLLARAKEIYDGREATGKYTWDCDKIFHAAADWSMEIRLASVEEQVARFAEEAGGTIKTSQIIKAKQKGPSFELEVTKGGNAIEEMGKVYTEEEWGEDGPFAYACSKLIPRTDVEDWK